MRAQMDVICCKSVGTDLSMLDIEDFITEICQLKKEVASLEAKLRERGDKPNREDLEKVSLCVTDGAEAQDSVWRSRDTQDSELSLTLLCYTDAQDHGSADQTSDCNAGEQQMKMCSVKLEDCRNLIERRGEETTAEEQQQSHEEEDEDQNNDDADDDVQDEDEDQNDDIDDDDFVPAVGTDLSMLDIEDFITEICQLKKEVASLEAKLRERGDKPNREDLEKVSVCVTDGTEAQDSVWRSRDTQDSELSLTLLCYTDAQDHGSADQTSDCNAGEQQMKMCSVKLEDCRNLIERRGEETTAEEQQQSHEEEEDEDQNNDDADDYVQDEDEDQNYDVDDEQDEDEDQNDDVDDDDFVPAEDIAGSSSDGETASTSKERRTVKSFSCGKTFSKQGHLAKSERKHTELKDFTCKICDISFSTSKERKRHSKEHSKKEFRCEQCGKDFFTTPYNMRAHIKTHSEKTLHCSECDKYFRTKQHLTMHKRIHTGEKPYKCPHCEKSFNQRSALKSHQLTHSNESPYKCPVCEKSFKCGTSLKKHLLIHTNENPYKCPVCEKSFKCGTSLKKHLLTHTSERPYQCSECDLKIHERWHTGEKPYRCSICAFVEMLFKKESMPEPVEALGAGGRCGTVASVQLLPITTGNTSCSPVHTGKYASEYEYGDQIGSLPYLPTPSLSSVKPQKKERLELSDGGAVTLFSLLVKPLKKERQLELSEDVDHESADGCDLL
ncbi:unnamed protein product [Leuciscus chuanchicus]